MAGTSPAMTENDVGNSEAKIHGSAAARAPIGPRLVLGGWKRLGRAYFEK